LLLLHGFHRLIQVLLHGLLHGGRLHGFFHRLLHRRRLLHGLLRNFPVRWCWWVHCSTEAFAAVIDLPEEAASWLEQQLPVRTRVVESLRGLLHGFHRQVCGEAVCQPIGDGLTRLWA